MEPITLTAVVDETHRLVIDLPEDLPVGPVELVIRSLAADAPPSEPHEMTREEARAKLVAAGLVSPYEDEDFPEAEELTPEEEERLGRLLAGGKSILDMVNEDREERF